MNAIDAIDAPLLKVACPENGLAALASWVDPFKAGCARFGVDTARKVACLLAQAGHESAGLTRLSENLNYSAQRLAEVWPARFAIDPKAKVKTPNALALNLARNPRAIANHVYANRMGNGPPASGDGWTYRGQGPFQLTGKRNQEAFGDAVGLSVDQVPAFLRTTAGGALSACWFFKVNGLDDLAATPGCADETRAVNGGLIGLADRTKRFDAVMSALKRKGVVGC